MGFAASFQLPCHGVLPTSSMHTPLRRRSSPFDERRQTPAERAAEAPSAPSTPSTDPGPHSQHGPGSHNATHLALLSAAHTAALHAVFGLGL